MASSTPRPLRLAAFLALASASGCQVDLSESFDDAFGTLRDPLELEIEVPADIPNDQVLVGLFDDACVAADGQLEDGTEQVVTACVWVQADGTLRWTANDNADVWLSPRGGIGGAPSVEFPGGLEMGRGFVVVWLDEDGDGRLFLDSDGLGEPTFVPQRTVRNETLLLNEVIVDGTGWSASRSVLDPNDLDAAEGSRLSDTELGGWVARFQ